jgi:Domain of unknown function (DUF1735)
MKKNLLKICIAFMGVSLVACLDDDKYALDPSGTDNVIEFYDPSVPTSPVGSVYPVWTASTEIQEEFTLDQTISYSGPNGNSKNIELTLAVDPVALIEYNEQMEVLGGGKYEMMPDSYFDFTDINVTIPKGEKKVNISITVYPDQFDLTKNFAVPLRIVSTSDGILSAHWSVAVLAVVVKNKYDGVYEITDGSITRNEPGGPDLVLGGDYKDGLKMELSTINGNTVGISPVWKDGGGIGGIDGTTLTIDEATNLVTVKSTNLTLKNTPATVNEFFPGTPSTPGAPDPQSFILNFDWGAAPRTRIIADLKIEYLKARD